MRLLIQTRTSSQRLRLQGLAARPVEITLRPLMPATAGMAAKTMGFAAGAAPTWHVTGELPAKANGWDICHSLLREGLGFGEGADIAFAEPDTEWENRAHDDPPRTAAWTSPQFDRTPGVTVRA